MSQESRTVYRFGPFRYDPAERVLYRDDELVPLAPKALDTLHVLLERRGEVVGKAELMQAVWPDCVVEEVGLARNISLLRKALGDDAGAYIETIPKRGYRFTAELHDGALASPPPARRRPTWLVLPAVLLALGGVVYWQFYRPSRYLPRAGGAATLAVVPVECLSPDLEPTAFSRGFTEALIEEIAKLKSVQVISNSTVERYRRLRIPTALMSRMLGLHVIVEGTAQSFGRQIRVSVRLTDVHSGRLIWAEGYELGAGDGQAQTQAARAVAAQIGQRLARR